LDPQWPQESLLHHQPRKETLVGGSYLLDLKNTLLFFFILFSFCKISLKMKIQHMSAIYIKKFSFFKILFFEMKHTLFPTYMTKFKNQKKKHHFYFSKVVKFTNIVETKVAKCEHLKSLIIYTLAQIGFFHEEMWIKVSMFN